MCQACFNERPPLSVIDRTLLNQKEPLLEPLAQSLYDQQLIFDAFMGTEILNDISSDISRIMSADVMHRCYQFYSIDLKSLINESGSSFDENAQLLVYNKLVDNGEYFMAYYILQSLWKYNEDGDNQAYYNILFGQLVELWMDEETEDIIEYVDIDDKNTNNGDDEACFDENDNMGNNPNTMSVSEMIDEIRNIC